MLGGAAEEACAGGAVIAADVELGAPTGGRIPVVPVVPRAELNGNCLLRLEGPRSDRVRVTEVVEVRFAMAAAWLWLTRVCVQLLVFVIGRKQSRRSIDVDIYRVFGAS